MRKIKIRGVVAFLVVAFGVFASSAFALESVWLVDAANPTAQSATIDVGVISLTDTKGGPFGGSVTVSCGRADGSGFVGPGKTDLLESVSFAMCEKTAGETCEKPIVAALNLPWITTIELIEGKFYDDIVTGATGQTEIGYLVECEVVGIKADDTCKQVLGRALLTNEASGTVDALFNSADPNQPPANCSRGGTGTGLVNGLNVVQSTTIALTVAVSEG